MDGIVSSLVRKREKEKRITQNSKNNKEFKFLRTINQLHEDGINILSKGCIFGGYGSKPSHCLSMAPGIHCSHPNSCALYARSSFLTNKIQQILGDDLMRELLLHTIVLVPTRTVDNSIMIDCNDKKRFPHQLLWTKVN